MAEQLYFNVTFDRLLDTFEVTYTSVKREKTLSRSFPRDKEKEALEFVRQKLQERALLGWTRLYVGDATARATRRVKSEIAFAWLTKGIFRK